MSNVANPSEHKFIKQVAAGQTISGVYYLEKFFEKTAKNGNKYTDVVLRDKSGSAANVKFWGTFKSITKGKYVKIEGSTEEYLGQPQVIISKIKLVETPKDLSNYLSIAETKETDIADFTELKKIVESLCNEVKDNTCINLLNALVDENYYNAVGSVLPFDGVVGGSLAHTVRVTKIVKDTLEKYCLSNKEKVVALTAALIHATGDVEAFEMKDCAPQETKLGVLLGRQQLTLNKINKVQLESPNADILARIQHVIVSMSGEIKPMSKEAIVVSQALKMDYEIIESFNFIVSDENEEEEFTAYDPILKRRYLKK